MIFDISPPVLYDFGLKAAIEWLIERTEKQHDILIEFNFHEELKSSDESFNILVFGAVRELLFNVVKHANANTATILIKRSNGSLIIHIMDDGAGFDTKDIGTHSDKSSGFGLFSIKERLNHLQGNLNIESSPGEGTHVSISVPMVLE